MQQMAQQQPAKKLGGLKKTHSNLSGFSGNGEDSKIQTYEIPRLPEGASQFSLEENLNDSINSSDSDADDSPNTKKNKDQKKMKNFLREHKLKELTPLICGNSLSIADLSSLTPQNIEKLLGRNYASYKDRLMQALGRVRNTKSVVNSVLKDFDN